MNPRHARVLPLTLLALAACGGSAEGPAPEVQAAAALPDTLPEVPAILRDVAMVQGGLMTRPGLPPFRTSADGRVASQIEDPTLKLHLVVPEKLTTALPLGAPGVTMLAQTTPFQGGLSANRLHASTRTGGITHKTLCDGTVAFPSDQRTNPRACGTSDCYDLTVIATHASTDSQNRKWIELWGTPLTVRVSNPKTAAAQLAEVTLGAPVLGPTLQVGSFFEPMTTVDGRLLVGRFGDSRHTWHNDRTGADVTGTYDIVYAAAPPNAAACDVRAFTRFKPISHAPYDPAMKGRYGIASYPFRDSEGTPIADGAELRTTYPWIDRQGNNLFSLSVGATAYYWDSTRSVVATRFPLDCVPGTGACTHATTQADLANYENNGNTRGLTVMGLWTHGKMVLLDGVLNNTDFGLMRADGLQRMVSLYQPGTGPRGDEPGAVRVGSGRDNSRDAVPAGQARNTTLVDSQENLYNHNVRARPLTWRDVVWQINSGKGSAEIAFDDYLDPHAFIVSEMNASLSWDGGVAGMPDYHDGFEWVGRSDTGRGYTREVRLQNAATTEARRWSVPAYGRVTGARIEPVALGGIEGRGLYLDGRARVEYDVPAQVFTPVDAVSWYVSVFVDARMPDDGAARRLLTFPDGTAIDVLGRRQLVLRRADGTAAATYPLPADRPLGYRAFTHLAWVVKSGGAVVDVYLDGLRWKTWTGSGSTRLFRMTAGTLTLGATPAVAGVAGWVDELKVLAHAPDAETACNHARGSIIGVVDTKSPWNTVARRYPAQTHTALTTQLTTSGHVGYARYACFVDYSADLRSHREAIPAGTVSLRDHLLFPEGPLEFGAPRPESRTNTFCLACHVDGEAPTLTPAALALTPGLPSELDRRRQPLQSPRLVFGLVPADYVGPGLPAAPQQAPPAGLLLDQWVLAP